jgi:hypothetical protein
MVSTLSKALVGSALVVLIAVAVKADTKPAPPPMPPGMTPAVYKMVMTLGPAHPAGLPANLVPVSGCIPTMGYHYAVPSTLPFGPIYGWYQGKPTFTEIMVAKTSFENGMSWSEQLVPLPGYKIDHVDIWFEAHGHPGYEIPHYDIHAWYVGHDEHMHYCGNTSGKKPSWL